MNNVKTEQMSQGTFPTVNARAVASKQTSQKAVNMLADIILKAVDLRINKLQSRIEKLEKTVNAKNGK